MLEAYACKDNFWSRLRAEKGIKIKEVAEYLHLSGGTVGAYFTGELMPSEDKINVLCDLFDVDSVLGAREFKKAHDKWVSESHKAKMIVGGKVEQKEPTKETVEEPTENVCTINGYAVCELLYGLLPYADYTIVYEGFMLGDFDGKDIEDVFKFLYGKVSYDIYCEVIKLVKEV